MDKPFKTIDEQIAILESRNMSTDSMTPLILKREGYYSVINGYKSLFLSGAETRRVGEDRYADGTAFKDVYRLFTFDRDLRMTMTRYFAQAEAMLKTICAYRFSEAHTKESEPYLNPQNFAGIVKGFPTAPACVILRRSTRSARRAQTLKEVRP